MNHFQSLIKEEWRIYRQTPSWSFQICGILCVCVLRQTSWGTCKFPVRCVAVLELWTRILEFFLASPILTDCFSEHLRLKKPTQCCRISFKYLLFSSLLATNTACNRGKRREIWCQFSRKPPYSTRQDARSSGPSIKQRNYQLSVENFGCFFVPCGGERCKETDVCTGHRLAFIIINTYIVNTCDSCMYNFFMCEWTK